MARHNARAGSGFVQRSQLDKGRLSNPGRLSLHLELEGSAGRPGAQRRQGVCGWEGDLSSVFSLLSRPSEEDSALGGSTVSLNDAGCLKWAPLIKQSSVGGSERALISYYVCSAIDFVVGVLITVGGESI